MRDHTAGDNVTRREALQTLAALGAGALLGADALAAQAAPSINTRAIPKSGERLPVLGLGSWITFNVGNDPQALDSCAQVVGHFAERGGRLIDSSPMYGSSQATIGYALRKLKDRSAIFSADKVWTSSASAAASQIAETQRRWGVAKLDLLEVHNLEGWEVHLPRLFAMKAAGTLRYVGVTTSHNRRLEDTEKLMRTQPLDFVQFTYNMVDREPEQRLLPLAQERGIAVITNRPFQEGALLEQLRGRPLPPWAAEIGAPTWPRFLLSYIVSHPAVTCAIPGHQPGGARGGEHERGVRPASRRGDEEAHGGVRRLALMSEWWTYRPHDLLMYSARAYYGLFALENSQLWPLPILAVCAGAAVIVLLWRGSMREQRIATAVLATAWFMVAWAFFVHQYSTIHTFARAFALAFVAQAILLLLEGVRPGVETSGAAPNSMRSRIGAALGGLALICIPLVTPLAGRPWAQAEIFGLAPDPTVGLTFGALLVYRPSRWWLWPLPLVWTVYNGATLWLLHAPGGLVLPAIAVVALATQRQRFVRGAGPRDVDSPP